MSASVEWGQSAQPISSGEKSPFPPAYLSLAFSPAPGNGCSFKLLSEPIGPEPWDGTLLKSVFRFLGDALSLLIFVDPDLVFLQRRHLMDLFPEDVSLGSTDGEEEELPPLTARDQAPSELQQEPASTRVVTHRH